MPELYPPVADLTEFEAEDPEDEGFRDRATSLEVVLAAQAGTRGFDSSRQKTQTFPHDSFGATGKPSQVRVC